MEYQGITQLMYCIVEKRGSLGTDVEERPVLLVIEHLE
jgi:hypothetical protein